MPPPNQTSDKAGSGGTKEVAVAAGEALYMGPDGSKYYKKEEYEQKYRLQIKENREMQKALSYYTEFMITEKPPSPYCFKIS